ncbi:hypothetical protein N7495_008982 [Penicillium taxi]|uniref:uncharacterized protein n=1 Tax=Penicillium taxi TaxID=168475 RepID=UPI002545837A|nr:uncharacterized protein N7495_008982 [Penicillium taxi]KAJ5888941.1 hypothetical protein N7495_008982 [Penicillium taxi]
MSNTILFYSLAATSIISALLVTILNGLAFGMHSFHVSEPSHRPNPGMASIGLGVVSCLALLVTSLLVHQDLRAERVWPRWKKAIFYLTGVYLILSAASTAGTMSINMDNIPTPLLIARSVFWGVSIFVEGLYYGLLLVISWSNKHGNEQNWPQSYSQQLKPLESPSWNSVSSPTPAICESDQYPEMNHFNARRSSLRKFPRSNRYSGSMLSVEQSINKHVSIETASSGASMPSPASDHMRDAIFEIDTRPLLRGSNSILSLPSLGHPPNSLDSLVHLPSPAPSTSPSTEIQTPRQSMDDQDRLAQEQNIHPLFRSTSPSPPTPTPGTRVRASPSAGQIITKKTLTRIRSARSLREQSMLTPPLPEFQSDYMPRYTSYNLSESPHE